MTTKQSLYDEIIESVVEDLRFEYSGKELKEMDQDVLDDRIYELMDIPMNNMTVYTNTCKDIIDACKFNVFSDDNMTGIRPDSIEEAAYMALFELIQDGEYECGFILGDVRIELGI